MRLLAEERKNNCVLAVRRFALLFALLAIFSAAAGAARVAAAAPARTPSSVSTSHPVLPPEQRIDINHATIAQLLKIPGMTPTWAGRIVRFRPYRTKRNLLDRGVLPGSVYDRIKDCIVAHRAAQ